MVYTVVALPAAGGASTTITGKHWLLEACADAPQERQAEVARLMGSFAERLLPHVELKKPA